MAAAPDPKGILVFTYSSSQLKRATRFRSLSQQLNDHVTPELQLDDDGYFYDAETGK